MKTNSEFGPILKFVILLPFSTLCIIQKISKSFQWYFVVWIFWILLSFGKFHVEQINCLDTSYSLAKILNFQISQSGVTTQLRWGGSLYNRHTKVSMKMYQWKNSETRFSFATNQSGCFLETRCMCVWSCQLSDIWWVCGLRSQRRTLTRGQSNFTTVSYTHLTLPTNREV